MKSQMIGHDADGDYDGADGVGGDAKPLNDQKRLVLSPLIPTKDSQNASVCQGPPLLPSVALKELKLAPLP